MKYGLFGGSFDPIHLSHLALCEACQSKLGLDKVFLMPTAQPPHKLKTLSVSSMERLKMCQMIVEDYPWIQVSDMEIQRGGASFTVDTLESLKKEYPDDEWYLLTGADMFCTLLTWFRFPDIAKMATLCTVPRGDSSLKALQSYAAKLEEQGAKTAIVEASLPPYSSTEIRHLIVEGNTAWKSMVPPAVSSYISNHHLYEKNDDSLPTTDEQFTEIIRRRLSDYRFEHSLAVARESKRLALLYGENPEKAYTAGLLHDILKDTPKNEQKQIADNFKIPLDAVEQVNTKLWHARIGSIFLEHILGIRDQDMLNAVRYHTTARAGMSLLEKIVYIADFTAEGRNYPDVEEMRKRSNESLESAMRYALAYTLQDLESKGCLVHPDTVAAYEEVHGTKWKGRD